MLGIIKHSLLIAVTTPYAIEKPIYIDILVTIPSFQKWKVCILLDYCPINQSDVFI